MLEKLTVDDLLRRLAEGHLGPDDWVNPAGPPWHLVEIRWETGEIVFAFRDAFGAWSSDGRGLQIDETKGAVIGIAAAAWGCVLTVDDAVVPLSQSPAEVVAVLSGAPGLLQATMDEPTGDHHDGQATMGEDDASDVRGRDARLRARDDGRGDAGQHRADSGAEAGQHAPRGTLRDA